MPAIFQSLEKKKLPLLALVGLPYGRIIDEGGNATKVFTMHQVEATLYDLAGDPDNTADEIQVLRDQISKTGMPENMGALMELLCTHETEDTEMAGMSFELCSGRNCSEIIPHGYVYWNKEREMGAGVVSLEGLFHLLTQELDDIVVPSQALVLLRQAREVSLPFTHKQYIENMEGLPPEKMRAARELGGYGRELPVYGISSLISALSELLGAEVLGPFPVPTEDQPDAGEPGDKPEAPKE